MIVGSRVKPLRGGRRLPAAALPAHALYLGYEMAKAVTALTLGKNYPQDQPLRWGFLTRTENAAGPADDLPQLG